MTFGEKKAKRGKEKTGSSEEDAATCEDAAFHSIVPTHADDGGGSFCSRGEGVEHAWDEGGDR